MAWLEGTAERDFQVEAPVERVSEFFADPGQFRECVPDLASLEEVDEDVWRFTLEELSAKGVSFQGEYVVEYRREGQDVVWGPAGEGDENMKAEGRAEIVEVGEGRTRVEYRETMSVQLPIPGLMTSVFNPIVGREVRKGVGEMLDCAVETLEREAA
jgi:carbon monoxide dehydrogenase subunit G